MTRLTEGATNAPRLTPVPRRKFRHLHWEAIVASGILTVLSLAILLGPLLWSVDPLALNLTRKYAGFSSEAPLGRDDFGRDILSRILNGGRLTFLGAFVVLAGCSGIGLTLGSMAGLATGRWGAGLGRLIDTFLSLPSLVIALGIVGVLGKSYGNLLLALVLAGWPWYARIYRSLVIRERSQPYVLAATTLGASRFRILWRHIGPNIVGPVIVIATTNLGNAMLSLAALSFLGLGVRPPAPEWGAMVSEARFRFQTHPWLIFAPGLAISLSSLCINILGDTLRDLFDPSNRT